LKDRKIENLFLYMLGELPAKMSVAVIRILGKKKGLLG